jgi:hypothetical protein
MLIRACGSCPRPRGAIPPVSVSDPDRHYLRGCDTCARARARTSVPSVTDAILGALTLPDIGQFFPDTDPRWTVIDVPKPKTLNAPLLSFVRRYEDS